MNRFNARDRSTIKILNDRENFRKVIESREFNLKKRKELQKILAEQTEKLYNAQQKKVKKIKAGRGKNLRGELARNKNLQRRFERGERRYAETEEPRVVGDPAPIVNIAGGAVAAPMTPEDRQLAMARLQLQAQQQQNQFILQDRRDREELAIRRGEAQGNLLLDQQRIAQEQEEQRGNRLIAEGRNRLDDYNNRERLRLDAAIAQGNLMAEQNRQRAQERQEDRRMEAHEAQIEANVDFELERNRLRELEIENNRAIAAEQQAIRRIELEAQRDNIPIPEIDAGPRNQPFNIGDHQFLGAMLQGLAQDRHREREAGQNLVRQFLEHNERVQGNLSNDILNQLFARAQQEGLRVQGHEAPQGPNPTPAASVITLPDRDRGQEIASEVRSILRSQPPPSYRDAVEGAQSRGALTELEQELNRPDPRLNADLDALQAQLNRSADNVQRFLAGAQPDAPPQDPDEVSSITFSEFERRVDAAEAEFDATSEGARRALEAERFNRENPFYLLEYDNPLADIELTQSQAESFDRQAAETTERELEALRDQGLTVQRLAQIQNREREGQGRFIMIERAEALERGLDQEQIEIGQQEQAVEEGAGVGVLQQAGEAVGGALVGAGGAIAGGVAEAGLGVLQGAGQAIVDQLPTPGQVGQAVGRGAIDLGGAVLGAGARAIGGLAQAGAEAIAGQGEVEDLPDELPVIPEATDEGELLEDIPISTQNPAEIANNTRDFDFGEFIIHQQQQADKQRRPTLLEQQQGPKYSIENTSDRPHKKLAPGERVNIVAYGKDAKDDSIGYYGSLNPASNRREGQPTKLQNKALNKSIDKGFLKLHKNF